MIIEIDGLELEHRINPRLKHTYLHIENDGTLLLKSNGRSMNEVCGFVRSKREWIEKKRRSLRPIPAMTPGKDILFKGALLPLERIAEDRIGVAEQSAAAWRKVYSRLYKEAAQAYLEPRTEFFSARMGIGFEGIRYRRMKRRWGSCTRTGMVTYNTLLMQLPPELIDYTIVHELAHRIHFNHSADFHALVRSVLDDEKRRRTAMRHLSAVMF